MSWYYAFFVALVIGRIVSHCYYKHINTSTFFNKSVLDSYVINDITSLLNLASKCFLVFFPSCCLCYSKIGLLNTVI